MSSGKLFQTAGAACEKARPAKARLVQILNDCWFLSYQYVMDTCF